MSSLEFLCFVLYENRIGMVDFVEMALCYRSGQESTYFLDPEDYM